MIEQPHAVLLRRQRDWDIEPRYLRSAVRLGANDSWLEAVLHKMAVVGSWVHAIWIASLVGLVLMLVFGTETVRRQAGDVVLVQTLGLLAVGLLMLRLAGLLALLAWWLKTWRSERLRPALVFLIEHVPTFAMMVLA